jgi:hypothetical protein
MSAQAQAVKKVAYLDRRLFHNDNNNFRMAPFWCDMGKILEIKKDVYAYWSANDTVKLLSDAGYQCIPVDKLSGHFGHGTFQSDLPAWYWDVYEICANRADAERWAHLIPDARIIKVTDEVREKLRLDRNAKIEEPDLGPPPQFGWFVKTTRCSTKHERRPAPIYADPIRELAGTDKTLKAILKGANIMIRPWINEIGAECEVRVFVRQGKVTGVSQQACYSILHVLPLMDATTVINAAQECYNGIANGLAPEHGFQDECTFDAYIVDEKMYLIEINSGMFGWGPAGAYLS